MDVVATGYSDKKQYHAPVTLHQRQRRCSNVKEVAEASKTLQQRPQRVQLVIAGVICC